MRLTGDEIKLVTFVLVALLVGATTKYYRGQHPPSLMSTPLPKNAIVRPASHHW